MKQKITLSLILFTLLALLAPPLLAQMPVTALATMQVSFWPDYDEPMVLVLLNGRVPEDAALPADVTIPIPADARIHAVAALADVGMVTIPYETAAGAITFATPDRGFRVEYYAPYDLDGDRRSFDFTWLSDLDVAEFAAEIQQPAAASNLTSEPPAVEQITGQTDGLVYHVLPTQAAGAGLPVEISFSYDLPGNSLTAAAAAPGAGPETAPAPAPIAAADSGPNWLLISVAGLGALLLAVGGTWFLTTRTQSARVSSKPRKPAPRRQETAAPRPASGAARFCHVCGTAAEAGDRFCHNCGAKLK